MTDLPLARHTDYGAESLDEADIARDPFEQFARWLAEAAARAVYEPNAMVLGTVDADGTPSSRTVLLRGVDERGLTFYTDRSSRKGRALAAHPVATALFPWYSVHRQVIVTGDVVLVDEDESDAYWAGRPRGSQVAGSASDQSQPIASRADLQARVDEFEQRFADDAEIPRPRRWGGYRIEPWRIEFWQGRTSRMHDRLVFARDRARPTEWSLERLQP
jgi:pyridoxamine 5'-phosphate oxidase